MIGPSLLLILLVAAYPIGYAIWLSLHEYSLIHQGLSRWAGFGNYSSALWGVESHAFWNAFKTTFLFTAISVTLELVLGLRWHWRCTRPSKAGRSCGRLFSCPGRS